MSSNKEVALLDKNSTTLEIANGLQNVMDENTMSNALSALHAMPKENFLVMTGEYFTFLPKTNYKIAVTGMSTINFKNEEDKEGEEKPTPVVEFKMYDPATMKVDSKTKQMTGELKNYVSGAAILVSTVSKVYEKAAKAGKTDFFVIGLDINTTEPQKSGNGKYMGMSIGMLFAGE